LVCTKGETPCPAESWRRPARSWPGGASGLARRTRSANPAAFCSDDGVFDQAASLRQLQPLPVALDPDQRTQAGSLDSGGPSSLRDKRHQGRSHTAAYRELGHSAAGTDSRRSVFVAPWIHHSKRSWKHTKTMGAPSGRQATTSESGSVNRQLPQYTRSGNRTEDAQKLPKPPHGRSVRRPWSRSRRAVATTHLSMA